MDRLGTVFNTVMKGVVGLMSMAMLLIVGYAVFSRNVLDRSVVWADTVSTWLFVWLVFLGSATAITKNAHMEIGIGKETLPPVPRKVATIIGYVAVIVASLFLADAGWKLLDVSGDTPAPAVGADLKWVLWALPVGGVLMALCALERLIRAVFKPAVALARELEEQKENTIEEVI